MWQKEEYVNIEHCRNHNHHKYRRYSNIEWCIIFSIRKRKAAAEASQEEGKAIATSADGWRKLCEKRDEDVRNKEEEIKVKDGKIDFYTTRLTSYEIRLADSKVRTTICRCSMLS